MLYNTYASARDAGNFAAGAVAQSSIVPNIVLDYGFGLYNESGNNKVVAGLIGYLHTIMGPLSGTAARYSTAKNGEDKLSRAGIEAGKSFMIGK